MTTETDATRKIERFTKLANTANLGTFIKFLVLNTDGDFTVHAEILGGDREKVKKFLNTAGVTYDKLPSEKERNVSKKAAAKKPAAPKKPAAKKAPAKKPAAKPAKAPAAKKAPKAPAVEKPVSAPAAAPVLAPHELPEAAPSKADIKKADREAKQKKITEDRAAAKLKKEEASVAKTAEAKKKADDKAAAKVISDQKKADDKAERQRVAAEKKEKKDAEKAARPPRASGGSGSWREGFDKSKLLKAEKAANDIPLFKVGTLRDSIHKALIKGATLSQVKTITGWKSVMGGMHQVAQLAGKRLKTNDAKKEGGEKIYTLTEAE